MDEGFLLADFESYIENRLKPSTVNLYITTLRCFFKEVSDYTNIDSYGKFLERHHNKKRSTYVHDVLRKFVKWLPKENISDDKRRIILELLDSGFKKKYKDPIKKTKLLSFEELMMIANNLEQYKNQIIAKIMIATGRRIGDVLRIPRNNIKWIPHQTKSGEYKTIIEIKFIEKGDKITTIQVFNPTILEDLDEFLKTKFLNEKYYFITDEEVKNPYDELKVIKWNYDNFRRDLWATCIKLNLNPHEITAHDFRRNFADQVWTKVLDRKDIQALQRLMGHKDVTTTIRYLRMSGKQNIDIIEELEAKRTQE